MRLTPMKRRDYEKWIRKHGWTLEKSGIDWTLVDSANTRICTIKITHPGGEIPKRDVHKTKIKLKEQGFE
jgi:hypothetical protein